MVIMDDVNRKLSAAFILDFQFERRHISFHSNLYFKVAAMRIIPHENSRKFFRYISHYVHFRHPIRAY